MNKPAPIKTNRVKRKHQPEWLTSEILDLMKERDKCKINGKLDEYRILRNKISKMIDKAKKEMFFEFCVDECLIEHAYIVCNIAVK